MNKQIFINLLVADLPKATAFYEAVGFTNNPQFSDETAAAMMLSNEIYVMLLTHDKFKQFTTKQLADTHTTISVIHSIALSSNDEVNEFADKAIAAGGTELKEPQDLGFMYYRSFSDLDGHHWETFFMDISKFPQQA